MLHLSRNYVFWVDPSISNYSRLFWTYRASTISDLPINLRLSRKRVSPLLYTYMLAWWIGDMGNMAEGTKNKVKTRASNQKSQVPSHFHSDFDFQVSLVSAGHGGAVEDRGWECSLGSGHKGNWQRFLYVADNPGFWPSHPPLEYFVPISPVAVPTSRTLPSTLPLHVLSQISPEVGGIGFSMTESFEVMRGWKWNSKIAPHLNLPK